MKVELKYLNSSTFKKGSFVNIDNEWKVTTKNPCCGTKCVNNESPYGTCKSRNGFVQLTTDGTIRYIKCAEGKVNKFPLITAANQLKSLSIVMFSRYFTLNSNLIWKKGLLLIRNLWYLVLSITAIQSKCGHLVALFTTKCKMRIFLKVSHLKISLGVMTMLLGVVLFIQLQDLRIKCHTLSTLKMESKFAIVLEGNNDYYQPFVQISGYSVETNFGQDLDAKPFSFDISKHLVAEEFYEFY
uniref:Uncharacterized protein n=1 Tax=Meloidogyne enterolobii TaxID=390850 RepID=A0A6V7VY10_MELEN|nr:unnamed protein product [Meloidogyne enterolobii]